MGFYAPGNSMAEHGVMDLDALAMAICPKEALRNYRQLNFTQKRHGGKIAVLPVWKHYRQQATRVMALYSHAPWLRLLPVRFVRMAADIFLK